MTTQTSSPFACRQCEFCKEAFRVDGGATGIESARHGAWFCSGGCLKLANLFKSEPGSVNPYARDALINTYNNCYTYLSKGEIVHVPRRNDERVSNEIDNGRIYLIKSLYQHTSDDNNHFGKYD